MQLALCYVYIIIIYYSYYYYYYYYYYCKLRITEWEKEIKQSENVNTVHKNTAAVATKEVGLDVSAEKSGCMFTYRAHIARESNNAAR